MAAALAIRPSETTLMDEHSSTFEPVLPAERALGRFVAGSGATVLLIVAIAAGALLGHLSPTVGARIGGWMDNTVIMLIGLLVLEVSFARLGSCRQNARFLGIAWTLNFVIVPTIGFVIASFFLSGQPLFYAGLVIYFMAPCTDWVLGFTRLAKGDTALGAILLPINMVSQLIFYPLYLHLFVDSVASVDTGAIVTTLLSWIVLPFAFAIVLRQVLAHLLSDPAFERLLRWAGIAIPFVISLLIIEIFAANIGVIAEHTPVFGTMLLAVFLFFVATFVVGELTSRAAALPYPQHALLTMTIGARNAPLMLAVTAITWPDQPLVYAAIVMGMLVEFPHLTALRQILIRSREKYATAGANLDPTQYEL